MSFSRGVFAPGVAALALVVTACKGGSDASTPKQAGTASGQVVSARYDAVIMKQDGSDKQLRLTVDPSTQVLMDGRFVRIERLAEGTPVRATHDASGKATRIEVLEQGAAGGQGAPGNSPGQAGGMTSGPPSPRASDADRPRGSSESVAGSKR